MQQREWANGRMVLCIVFLVASASASCAVLQQKHCDTINHQPSQHGVLNPSSIIRRPLENQNQNQTWNPYSSCSVQSVAVAVAIRLAW
jgi:hypothetical protein